MDGANCVQVLATSDELGCRDLQKAALNHIISNFDAACTSPSFIGLSTELFVAVMRHVSPGAHHVAACAARLRLPARRCSNVW